MIIEFKKKIINRFYKKESLCNDSYYWIELIQNNRNKKRDILSDNYDEYLEEARLFFYIATYEIMRSVDIIKDLRVDIRNFIQWYRL